MLKIAAAAIISGQAMVYSVRKVVRPTDNTHFWELKIRDRAKKKSFQASKNEKTTTTTSPGFSSGTVTRRKAPKREQPSTIACSSRSGGSDSTKPRISQIDSGS